MLQNRLGKILSTFLILSALAIYTPAQNADSTLLSIDRIFASGEFSPQGVGGFRWLKSGDAYTRIEALCQPLKAARIWSVMTLRPMNAKVLLSADKLIPTRRNKAFPNQRLRMVGR